MAEQNTLNRHPSKKTLFEPFKIKMVEPVAISNESRRAQKMEAVGFNPFLLHSVDVMAD